MILLDTCALYWWTLAPEGLSPLAYKRITDSKPDSLLVSSISIWEIGWKAKQGKLPLPGSITEYLQRLESTQQIKILPVTSSLWTRVVEMDWTHRDPADRTIVATAEQEKATLLTEDSVIQKFYPRCEW